MTADFLLSSKLPSLLSPIAGIYSVTIVFLRILGLQSQLVRLPCLLANLRCQFISSMKARSIHICYRKRNVAGNSFMFIAIVYCNIVLV